MTTRCHKKKHRSTEYLLLSHSIDFPLRNLYSLNYRAFTGRIRETDAIRSRFQVNVYDRRRKNRGTESVCKIERVRRPVIDRDFGMNIDLTLVPHFIVGIGKIIR